jgi:antitoxin component YwqK of YwqJK toxin-antitoxin module
MARKPQLWIARLAMSFALPVAASAALAEDMPTLAPIPAPGVEIKQAIADAEPTVRGAVEPAPIEDTSAAKPASDAADEQVEVIRERHPNTAVKVERHVTQDAEGNYYNHGLWTQWDEKSRLVGTGEYRYGKRHGRWLRWYAPGEAPMLAGPIYKEFQPPFVAEATFDDGVLHGTWKVFDVKNRKVSEWEFDHGDRHGKSVWYYPNGQKRREVDYRQGQIDGQVMEWEHGNKLVSNEKYVDGHRLAPQTDNYAPGQKRAEGWVLYAKENLKSNYDFWAGVAKVEVVGTEGVNQRHGLWTWWHKNGQKQMEGRYEQDMPIGKFTWWYPNGQKQLQGEYTGGKQAGKFTWWHPNGQKQLEGAYLAGVLSGKWTRWNNDGRVVEVGDYTLDGSRQQLAQEPTTLPTGEDVSPTLQAVQPAKATPGSSRLKR